MMGLVAATFEQLRRRFLAAALPALIMCTVTHAAVEQAIPTLPALPSLAPPIDPLAEPPVEQLTEIVVHASEPRFVAPTRRDRIGRIWAPVFINDKGPFRLVLDSGANHSGINSHVAEVLGLPLNQSRHMLLRGVTGAAAVPTVRIDSFTVGDMEFGSSELPIVTDALGGADGILGTDGMSERRISVDFRNDQIIIMRSHNARAAPGFRTIPFELIRGNLVAVPATVGGIHTTAIIDTGGQVTIANLALRRALESRWSQIKTHLEEIEGVTTDVQDGDAGRTPPLLMGESDQGGVVEIHYHDMTFGDMHIFEHWHLTEEPVMLIGMDALGLLDTLIIDYRRHELQVRMRDQD
jgi:hypothetical protein